MTNFTKKLLSVFCAGVMTLTFVTGCSSSTEIASTCEHSYGVYTIDKVATCSEEGQKHHTCSICYNVEYESIEIDPDNHSYGDWEVSDENVDGTRLAAKKCSGCNKSYSVILPELTDSAYSSKIVTRPTSTTVGSSMYTYHDDEIEAAGFEDIVFYVDVTANGIQTVSDCVDLATSDESKALIYSASGSHGEVMSESAGTVSVSAASSGDSFSWTFYEDGNGFTYVSLNGGEEYWVITIDDEGNTFGTSNVTFTTAYLEGYRLYFSHTTPIGEACGTENMLSLLYTYAKKNYNNDFSETITKNYDSLGNVYSYDCTFHFGVVNEYGGSVNGGEFSVFDVKFTMLASSFTISYFEAYSVVYMNWGSDYNNCTYTETDFTDANGFTVGYWNSDAPYNYYYEYDEDGNVSGQYAYVQNAAGLRYYEAIVVNQTVKTNDGTQEQKLLQSYGLSSNFYYTDYTVTYNGKVLEWEANTDRGTTEYECTTTIEVEYDATYYPLATISDLTPSDASNDSMTFYLRSYTNAKKTKYTETKLDSNDSYGTALAYVRNGNLIFRSWVTGTWYLTIKTAKITRIIPIYTSGGASEGSTLFPVVYTYSNGEYFSQTSSGKEGSQVTGTATVQVGGILYYKAVQVLDGVESVVTYESSCSSDYVSVVDGVTISGLSGVSSFSATKAGTYTITIITGDGSTISDEYENVTVQTCYLKVTVTSAPDLDDILSGTYSGKLTSNYEVSVTFGEYTHEKVETAYTLTTELTTLGVTLYKHTATVYVNYEGINSLITITYYSTKEDGSGTVYYADTYGSYTVFYEATSCDEMFVTEYDAEEADEYEYYFALEFTGNYNLILTQVMINEDLYGSDGYAYTANLS